jgi:prevent-host-death family protein
MATETLTLSQLEPRLSELVDRAHQSLDRFFITRNGHTEAVLLGAADFEGLVETLEILSDHEAVRELIQAERELSQGDGHPIEAIHQELGV